MASDGENIMQRLATEMRKDEGNGIYKEEGGDKCAAYLPPPAHKKFEILNTFHFC